MGSSSPACGRNCKYSDISMHCSALFTISWLSSVSNTTVAPSSMYPSTPPFMLSGREMSAWAALPNGVSLGRRFGGGISSDRGVFRSSGFHWLQCIRSFARSKVMSEQLENSAGAGFDPNGSRLSAMATSVFLVLCGVSPSSAYQSAMHFDAVSPVTWRRR